MHKIILRLPDYGTSQPGPFVCGSPAMDNVVKELSSQAVTQGTWCACRHSQQTNNRIETTSQKQASAHENFLERETCKLSQ